MQTYLDYEAQEGGEVNYVEDLMIRAVRVMVNIFLRKVVKYYQQLCTHRHHSTLTVLSITKRAK